MVVRMRIVIRGRVIRGVVLCRRIGFDWFRGKVSFSEYFVL